MLGNEYQEYAMRTNDGKASKRIKVLTKKLKTENSDLDLGGIINASLGLSGESGELNDMIKKWVFHEKELDIEHLKKEIGDVLWYVAMMCDSCGFNMNEIMRINIDKLKARYPEGFDVERANHRDIHDL